MKQLYSLNQLIALYGKKDKQVIAITKFIELIGNCVSNKTFEAFKRIDKN